MEVLLMEEENTDAIFVRVFLRRRKTKTSLRFER